MSFHPPPIVLHIPHASTFIPPAERSQFILNDADLSLELVRMTDRYTDELFDLSEDVACKVIFGYSRLLVDPERFRDDADEPMASRGMGVVYTKTSLGENLRLPVNKADRDRLLATYYDPHHTAMMKAVDEALEEHGRCLIIDCHSFPSQALPCGLDQQPGRPDICIGVDELHTPASLADDAVDLFRSAGWSVDINRPYAGAFVPIKHYGRDRRVSSVMIEVSRQLYMDEVSGAKLMVFDGVAAAVHNALITLIGIID